MVRTDEYSSLHLSGRLFQQYMADQWAKVDQDNLRYIRNNQQQIRADLYNRLADALAADDIRNAVRIVLPSSFIGGPRNKQQLYRDAMAVVAEKGCNTAHCAVLLLTRPSSRVI